MYRDGVRTLERLHVRLLGGLEIDGIELSALGSRKARLLVKLLALRRGATVPVDSIAEALWGDELPAKPAEQVAVLVSRLRRVLDAERLVHADGGYALRADWLDVTALDDLVGEAHRRFAAGSYAASRAAATAALALIRGPLLPEEADAAWCTAPRAAAERAAQRVRVLAAEAALAAGDPVSAADLAAAALDADGYDEAALRLLMTAAAAAGRPGAGLAAYESVRRRLDAELGVRPARETEAGYLALLSEEPALPSPPTRRTGRRVRPNLPGRAEELRSLDESLERAADGRVQVVEVAGEPGSGKTALLTAWTAGLGENATLLAARCDQLGRDLPLQPLLDALALHLRRTDREAVHLLGAEAHLLGPLLGLGPITPDAVEAYAGEGLGPTLLFVAVLDVIARLADRQPVVITLDDAHLADSMTVSWLTWAASRPAESPLLLVLARRPDDGGAKLPPAHTTLWLGALDLAAAEEVVGREAAARVYERSGGNPLFLVELAHSDDPSALPASLRDAVGQQVARAGTAVAALKAAAVLGPDVDLDVLASVLNRPAAGLLDDLEEGVRRRLLEERGARFGFRHELVREALAADTSVARRALLHRGAVHALAARDDADPLDIAHHARLAGDLVSAARALGAAAAVASARLDHDEAHRLLDEALTLRDGPALRRQRARVRLMLMRYTDAAADAAAALSADQSADSFEVAAQTAYYARDFPRAATLAVEASRRADEPMQRARCLAFAGRSLHAEGELTAAEERLTAAWVVPGAASLLEVRVWIGGLRLHQSHPEEAVRLLRDSEETDDPLPFTPVIASMNRALANAQLGLPLDALADLDRMAEQIERRQLTRYHGRSENCRAFVLRNLGSLAEADEWNVRGAEGGRAISHAEPLAHSLLDRVDGRLEVGDHDTAAALLAEAAPLQATPHAYRWRHVLRAHLLHGRFAMATGDAASAEEQAELVLADALGRGVARYEVLARLLLAQARHAQHQRVDRAAIAQDLQALGPLAGLDAWRVTLDVAADFAVVPWRRLGETRVELLATAAGQRGPALRAYAAQRQVRR